MGLRSCYIFLDEVTSVRDWWKVVKGHIDAGSFRRDVLVLTGSSSLRLRGETELFPGRMGGGGEVMAWPLSFREYLSVRGLVLERHEGFDVRHLLHLSGKIARLFEEYAELGELFPLDQ